MAAQEQSVTHSETTWLKRLGRFMLSLCLAADPCLVSVEVGQAVRSA